MWEENPEAKARYVAVHESIGWFPKATAELQRDPKAIAVLQYGTQEKVRARVVIREVSESSDTVWRNVEIKIKNHYRKGSGDSDFSVILMWEDSPEVVIPFKNDAPRLGEAKLPAGLSIEAARTN